MANEGFNSWKHYLKKPTFTDEKGKGKSMGCLIPSIHNFYKQVAGFYESNLSDLIHNILLDWKEKHEKHIQEDMISKIKEKANLSS